MNAAFQLCTIAGVLFLGVLSPSFALVTSTSMTVSRRAGVLTGLGLAAASFAWALLAVAGIGVMLVRLPWIYAAIVLIAVSVSAAWYCGLAILFSHEAARQVFAKVKTGIETSMGLILVASGGKLLLIH